MTQDAASLTIHHDFFLEALRRMKELLQVSMENMWMEKNLRETGREDLQIIGYVMVKESLLAVDWSQL